MNDVFLKETSTGFKAISIENCLNRLRESRELESSDDGAAGFLAGAEWALERAEFGALKRIAEFGDLAGEPLAPHDWATLVAACAAGDAALKPAELGEQLETMFGATHPSRDFVAAFVEGAAEIYQRI
jgi:hypothetical protein